MRTYQPTRREQVRYFWRQCSPLLLVLAVVTAPLGYWAWRHLASDRDFVGRPYLEAVVTIEAVDDLPPSKTGVARPYALRLDLAGTKLWVFSSLPVRPGQRVDVRYRIGRSGTVYVSSVSLIPGILPGPGIGPTPATADATAP